MPTSHAFPPASRSVYMFLVLQMSGVTVSSHASKSSSPGAKSAAETRLGDPFRPGKAASPASVWTRLLFKTSGSAKWSRDPGRRQIESLAHSQLGESHRSCKSSHIIPFKVCRRPVRAHVAPGLLSDSTPKFAGDQGRSDRGRPSPFLWQIRMSWCVCPC